MKERKHFLLVFAICWVIGLTGGYYLGLGSAMVPTEYIEYNYYFSEKAEDSDVEAINKKCPHTKENEQPDKDDNFFTVIKNAGILEMPKKFINKLFSN